MHAVALAGVSHPAAARCDDDDDDGPKTPNESRKIFFSWFRFGSNFDSPRGSMCVSLHFLLSLAKAQS